jgi:hypothetical protein
MNPQTYRPGGQVLRIGPALSTTRLQRMENIAGRSLGFEDQAKRLGEAEHAARQELVRFEVFTAVATKNGVFWDVTPCVSCKNRRFGGT